MENDVLEEWEKLKAEIEAEELEEGTRRHLERCGDPKQRELSDTELKQGDRRIRELAKENRK